MYLVYVSAHFTTGFELSGLAPVKEEQGGGWGVVLFREALAVCRVVKSLTPVHPPAHSPGMQCVFLMNQLSICGV